jgi:uncharacterized RDD family membrane protein YckC
MMREVVFRTDLGEELRATPGSLPRRLFAAAIDQGGYAFLGVFLLLLSIADTPTFRDPGDGASAFLTVAILGLWIVAPAWRQRRLGVTRAQRWMDLRLLRKDGSPPTLGDLLVRQALLPLDLFTPLVLLPVFAGRSLGEQAAGLVLVRPVPPRGAR